MGATARRLLLTLLPAVAVIAVLAFGLMKSSPTAVTPGSEVPAFELETLNGDDLSSEDLRGHPVVLNFWASWCASCSSEFPALERVWKEFRDDGLIVVGVNIRDAESAARRYTSEYGVSFPVVRDEQLELVRELGVVGVPETYFIDHEWRFVTALSGARQGTQQGTVVLGPISEEALLENVEVLLRRAASGRSSP
ncbi:MAG: TlpA family protein disulfide reductase [Actinomycetota bacterium]